MIVFQNGINLVHAQIAAGWPNAGPRAGRVGVQAEIKTGASERLGIEPGSGARATSVNSSSRTSRRIHPAKAAVVSR